MNAVEFQATLHNGMITLPNDQQSWNGKKIKVILLDETNTDVVELPTIALTSEADFFSFVGIWETRDITQESMRAKAWPDNS